MSARDVARRYIEAVLFEDDEAEGVAAGKAAELGPEDRALFQELTHGTIREWLFLDWIIAKYAPKPPRSALRTVLNISSYQLLFLDRVPDYAIFSQAAAISSGLGVSEQELKFVHGVLKTIQRNKDKLLEMRESSLMRARQGMAPEGALEWAALNAASPLLDALTVVEEKGQKKQARVRAVKALAAMKERGHLVGYVLPGAVPKSAFASARSEVAPQAVVFENPARLGEDLRDGSVRIQGEASQWACRLAADWLNKRRGQGQLRVLEMATGKGGKLLGTLVALTEIWGGNRESVPPIEWVATDSSALQLAVLERDAVALVKKLWPQVKVQARSVDWRSPPSPETLGRDFDLVWLDAPCTGFGTLSKLPQIALTRGRAAYDEALKLGELQQTLCANGLAFMRAQPAGALLYTVCTLTRPETFDVVDFLKATHGRKPELVQALWPGSSPAPDAEGFFAALL
ncbi:MAG: hypothetical protein HY075_00570 [Deltaproteobacteria bacterium]|nr:hypothetical protein [Deltaproteobacteria bacterium]